ncbi:MAG: hypothetical protein HFE63_08030 [Clostridiales bacterium]|nr:hypothetical protein [Clostridiales bacterium]
MKHIRIAAFATVLVMVSTFCRCDNAKNDTDIDSDQYIVQNTDSNSEYEIPSWLTLEEAYQPCETVPENSIVSLTGSNYITAGDRLYYMSSTTDNISMWAYISMLTGESYLVCPDPLCKHTDNNCQYLGFSTKILVDEEDSTVFYTFKSTTTSNENYNSLCRVDTTNDTITELFRGDPYTSSENDIYYLDFISDRKIYFTNLHYIRKDDGNGNISKTVTEQLMYTDLDSGKTIALDNQYSDLSHGEPYYADESYIYFLDQRGGQFYATDHNFKNEMEILTFNDGYQVRNVYYDKLSNEFYLCIAADEMNGSAEAENTEGYICHIDENLNTERLNMPSKSIFDFYLTDDHIYYINYDPVSYGMSPRGSISVDETGGKIYRVSRKTMQDPELVFDGESKLFLRLSNCFIINDYMYLDYYALIDEGSMAWFRNMNKAVRINLKEKTLKWLILQ